MSSRRINRVARHVLVSGESTVQAKEEDLDMDMDEGKEDATAANQAIPRDPERERLREKLKSMPRLSKDLSLWTATELLQRAAAMGAEPAMLDAALLSDSTKAELERIVEALEPPAPSSVTVEMITMDPAVATVEEMAEVLERVGVLVILNAADEATIGAHSAETH